MLKALKKRLKNERGLTLIELLAVVVILGIIAAIAVPSIGGIIKKTENDATVAEGIQIINAAKLYVTSNAPTADSTDLTKDQLAGFLDNIKSDGYTVTVTKNATTGKYSYDLTDHPSVALADTGGGTDDAKDSVASETELLAY
ncbi:type II secretion system protein [Cytobacillus sp. FJAT-54145]|uniref:Type II secretion system protein n=1 Tax=Cytobacillus spartinae TaxID=3299023 RepID=A0ABW6KL21_9BACI